MDDYPQALERLIDALQTLPTVGPKSAARLAFHILQAPTSEVEALASSLLETRERIHPCPTCFHLTDLEICSICSDPRRDATILCVVGQPKDAFAIERTREFRGKYHILQGLINPIEGITAERLRVRELHQRVREEPIREVILATDPTVSGEATALYLNRELEDLVQVTRLASGVAVGSDLEYTDEVTLGRALRGRRAL
jgi:recombination protein RecR